MRPAVSTSFCLPVKNGWHWEQISTVMSFRVEPTSNSAPQWVVDLFPTMTSREDGGYVKVVEDYWLGADHLGRDMFSRILYGTRISLLVAFIGPIVALIVGVTLGLISGYAGGWVDNLIMRFTDIMYAFPTLLLIILLMSFFRSSMGHLEPGSFAYAMGELDAASGNQPQFIHRQIPRSDFSIK